MTCFACDDGSSFSERSDPRFLPSLEIVYGSFAFVVCLGLLLQKKRRSPLRIARAAIASSLLFFIITNFGVCAFHTLYPTIVAGLVECYAAAIPFFQNTPIGYALYTTVLFGGFASAVGLVPALHEPKSLPAQSA